MPETSENEYEASWAPKDPRDKLYDTNVTAAEKVGSVFRVVAAFHPVLNVPVLMYDAFRKFGVLRSVFVWCAIIPVIGGYAWFRMTGGD